MAPLRCFFVLSIFPVVCVRTNGKGDGETAIGPPKAIYHNFNYRRSDDEANLVKRYMALVNRCDYRKPYVTASVCLFP